MTPYGILHKLATSFSKNQFQSFSDNLFISFDSDMKNGPSSLFLPSRSYFIIFQLEPINFTIFVAISSNSKTYFENRGIATNVDVLQEHILKKTANLHRFGGKIGRCIMSEILLIFGCPGCQVDFRNNLIGWKTHTFQKTEHPNQHLLSICTPKLLDKLPLPLGRHFSEGVRLRKL